LGLLFEVCATKNDSLELERGGLWDERAHGKNIAAQEHENTQADGVLLRRKGYGVAQSSWLPMR